MNQQTTRIYNKTQIAAHIRKQLAAAYPKTKGYVFSVTKETYSGGGSIHVSIMHTPHNIIAEPQKWPAELKNHIVCMLHARDPYLTPEAIEERLHTVQRKGHHQLNTHWTQEPYNPTKWNNGVFLTEEGHNFIAKVTEICQELNWDNSDSQTDYFDVNYYLHLNIGKWDKEYTYGGEE